MCVSFKYVAPRDSDLELDALGDDAVPFPFPRLPWDRLAELVAEADSKTTVSGYGIAVVEFNFILINDD